MMAVPGYREPGDFGQARQRRDPASRQGIRCPRNGPPALCTAAATTGHRHEMLALADKFGAQDEPLDALVAAIDLLRIARQADRLDDGTDLERLARPLDL